MIQQFLYFYYKTVGEIDYNNIFLWYLKKFFFRQRDLQES